MIKAVWSAFDLSLYAELVPLKKDIKGDYIVSKYFENYVVSICVSSSQNKWCWYPKEPSTHSICFG